MHTLNHSMKNRLATFAFAAALAGCGTNVEKLGPDHKKCTPDITVVTQPDLAQDTVDRLVGDTNKRLAVFRSGGKPIGDLVKDRGNAVNPAVDWNRVAPFHPRLPKIAERTERPIEELLQRCYGVFTPAPTTPASPEVAAQSFLKVYAEEDDNLPNLLYALLKPEHRASIPELTREVVLKSPKGEWRLPVDLLDTDSLAQGLLWINLRDIDDHAQIRYKTAPSTKAIKAVQKKTKKASQPHQVIYHNLHGFEAVRNGTLTAFLKKKADRLVKVTGEEADATYVLDPRGIYSSCKADVYSGQQEAIKHVYEPTFELIKEAGDNLNTKLRAAGWPGRYRVQVVVTALSRTVEYQKCLANGNGNATGAGKSSHVRFNAADLSYQNLQVLDTETGATLMVNATTHPGLMGTAHKVMLDYFKERWEFGTALGVVEINSQCFHVVGL